MSFHHKTTLPIDFVLHYYGHKPAEVESAALVYFVPWRDDSEPSLAVFPSEGSQIFDRWADRARQGGGDLYDLIGKINPDYGHAQIFAKADEIAAALEVEGWEGPPVPERQTRTVEDMRADVARASLDKASSIPLLQWLDNKGLGFGPDWLFNVWECAWDGHNLTMPYHDSDGEVVGYRYRTLESKPLSPAGAKITHGYGLHLHEEGKPFVICEGESDTWTLHDVVGDRFNVVGIPGASIHPQNIETGIGGYPSRVFLFFDGDAAGREAARKWADHLLTGGHEVYVVPVPDDKDASQLGQACRGLLERALPVVPPLPGLIRLGSRYFRATKDGEPGAQISGFAFDVLTRIATDDGPAYEVRAHGVRHTITTYHLLNSRALKVWAAERSLSWSGGDKDVDILRSTLEADSLFASHVRGTTVAGLHDGGFVFPGGHIGEVAMVHLDDGFDRGLVDDDVSIDTERVDRRDALTAVKGFYQLFTPDVTTPMLAWLFAAPLRSTVREFPYLNISGEFGVGKSGMLEKYIPIITGCHRVMALGTKPTSYAMTALAAGSNAFPVMFDEYRTNNALATKDVLEQMDNLIRASWNGGVRETGGHPNDPKRIMRLPVSAPLIVAGEDEKQTGSTRQRMVPIYLRKQDRGSDALLMTQYGNSDVPALYLQWLEMTGHTLETRLAGPDDLDTRMRYTIGYLEQGWALMKDWLISLGIVWDAPLDLSTVIDTFRENEAQHPLLTAISEVIGATANRADRPVWIEDGYVYLRPGPFVAEARRLGLDVGNAATVGKLLGQYGAESRKKDGGPVRVFPEHILE